MQTMARKRKQFDEVDRARADVGRQVGRIVAVLGCGDIPAAARAAAVLAGLGPFAVASLARALPRAHSTSHGLAIVAVLEAAGQAGAQAVPVLRKAAGRAKDPAVRIWAGMSRARLIGSPIFRGPVPGADGRPPEAYWRERLTDADVAAGLWAPLAADADVRRSRLHVIGKPVADCPGPRSAHDDVLDRAVGLLAKAVTRLIELLDRDECATLAKAALALGDIGPFAVGPLGSALLAAPEPRHRGMMIVVLNGLASRSPGAVLDALEPLIAREDNPFVLEAARALRADLLAGKDVGDATAAISLAPAAR